MKPISPESLYAASAGAELSDLIATAKAPNHVMPAERWRRIVELARLLRGPENSAPLRELLELVEATR